MKLVIYLYATGKRLVNCLRDKLSASSLLSKKEVRTDSSVIIINDFKKRVKGKLTEWQGGESSSMLWFN